MRVLGLDIGEKRIGVAVSDDGGRVAMPLVCLDAAAVRADVRALTQLIDGYGIERVVVGLPLSLDGSEGPQAARVRRAVERFEPSLGVPVDYADERLSSAEATRHMRSGGASERVQRGKKDMVAASVVLQAYLDSHDDVRSGGTDR